MYFNFITLCSTFDSFFVNFNEYSSTFIPSSLNICIIPFQSTFSNFDSFYFISNLPSSIFNSCYSTFDPRSSILTYVFQVLLFFDLSSTLISVISLLTYIIPLLIHILSHSNIYSSNLSMLFPFKSNYFHF